MKSQEFFLKASSHLIFRLFVNLTLRHTIHNLFLLISSQRVCDSIITAVYEEMHASKAKSGYI